MRYADLIDILEGRAAEAGLQSIDALGWLLRTYDALQQMADTWDLDALTVRNDSLFITTAGLDTYDLPHDFGRLLHPVEDDTESGIRIWNGRDERDLQYYQPARFHLARETSQGSPDGFTILGRQLRLTRPPDGNGGANYTGRGTYVATVERPRMRAEVPLSEPSQLIEYVWAMATGQQFGAAGIRAMSILSNNQAKTRLALFRSRERIGRRRR